jgi:hypothetical protein
MNAPITYVADATGPRWRRTRRHASRDGGNGRDGIENAADGRRAGRKNLEAEPFGFLPLQPIEIPQNDQSFVWKSLDKNRLDLEKLAEKLWRPPLFRRLPQRRGAGLGRWLGHCRRPECDASCGSRSSDEEGKIPRCKALKNHETGKNLAPRSRVRLKPGGLDDYPCPSPAAASARSPSRYVG